MFFPRTLIIAAEPPLRATLVEQFAALGRYALRDDQLGAPGEDWPDAAIVDEAHCDPKALADARARGCRTRVVLIADEPKSPPLGVDAVVTRPFRFAELVALIEFHACSGGCRPLSFRGRRTPGAFWRALEADRKRDGDFREAGARAWRDGVARGAASRRVGLRSEYVDPYARNAHSPSETQTRAVARTAALDQNRRRRLPARRQRRGPRVLTLTPAPPAHIEIAWGTPNKVT